MTLVIVRHAERVDYVERRAWMDAAELPWDSPITPHGHVQAELTGAALRLHLERLGEPLPTQMFTSPLTRCVQTSVGIRKGLGLAELPIHVDNHLVEALCEDWYRSWGIVGRSDATWGGPPGFETGTPVPDASLLRPAVFRPAHELLPNRQALIETAGLALGHSSHETEFHPTNTINNPETHEELVQRIAGFARRVHEQYPGQTVVLCSHGGPSAALYKALTNAPTKRVGFTAISIVVKGPDDADFVPRLTACTEHLSQSEDLGFATAFNAASEDLQGAAASSTEDSKASTPAAGDLAA